MDNRECLGNCSSPELFLVKNIIDLIQRLAVILAEAVLADLALEVEVLVDEDLELAVRMMETAVTMGQERYRMTPVRFTLVA